MEAVKDHTVVSEYSKTHLLLKTDSGLYIVEKPEYWDEDLRKVCLTLIKRSIMKKLFTNPWTSGILLIAMFWIPAYFIDASNGSLGRLIDFSDTVAVLMFTAPFLVILTFIGYQTIKK